MGFKSSSPHSAFVAVGNIPSPRESEAVPDDRDLVGYIFRDVTQGFSRKGDTGGDFRVQKAEFPRVCDDNVATGLTAC